MDDGHVRSVTAFTHPYDRWDRYQTYYREGLRRAAATRKVAFAAVPVTRAPRVLGLTKRVRDRYVARIPGTAAVSLLDHAAAALQGSHPLRTPSSLFHDAVGQYLVETDHGAVRRVCIDAADYPTLPCEDLVAWSDVYFKANRWSSRSYPANVLPVVSGDPTVLRRLGMLRTLRRAEKKCDLCFIVRVWGGSTELGGIEHCLRLLEAVNKARCTKIILAYLVVGDIEADARRLSRAGIPSTTHGVRAERLWQSMAESRINVVRLGKHYCIPWRVAGALAIGACIAFDQEPPARWPTPLLEGTNFLNLGATTLESAVADADSYSEIPARIEEWLSESKRLERIMEANGEYFDRFVDPERVGEQILATAVM
jgi:hypothetical protein